MYSKSWSQAELLAHTEQSQHPSQLLECGGFWSRFPLRDLHTKGCVGPFYP